MIYGNYEKNKYYVRGKIIKFEFINLNSALVFKKPFNDTSVNKWKIFKGIGILYFIWMFSFIYKITIMR